MKKSTLTLLLLVTSLVFYGQQNYQWTFMKGDTALPQYPVFGTKKVAAPTNKPAGRQYAAQWTDAAGDTWIFGGSGNGSGSLGGYGQMNDLWKYTPANNQWTWMSGDSLLGKNGVYGTKGVEASTNKPGAREGALAWRGSSGDLYLFGGYGLTASGTWGGYLNDLWKYSPATGNWTWISGDNTGGQAGIYGTMGTAAAANKPGGRMNSVGWVDASGNLWIFGGFGLNNSSGTNYLSDLWRYNVSTGQWTWMHGNSTLNAVGVYGTKNSSAATNKPGSRRYATGVKDASGRFWLIGGFGYGESTSANGKMNDAWMYNPTNNQWTWVSGDKALNQVGVYGTKGTQTATNKMGARQQAISWIDASNNIYVFGGNGYTATGSNGYQYLNDLWRYSISAGQWTWISGVNTVSNTIPAAIYGTKGTATSANVPSGKTSGISWIDASGNLWMFGGLGSTATGSGYLNDTWKFTPSSAQWTWVSGDNQTNYFGVYGSKGVASVLNQPGSRRGGANWVDASGNLWMFGGNGYHATSSGSLNDLWKFDPSTRFWTWVAGDNTTAVSVYGTKGTPAATNKPGGRSDCISWQDPAGNFWLFGGYGYGTTTGTVGYLCDVWKYTPSTGQWAWMSGDVTMNPAPVYGSKGSSSATTRPGGRSPGAATTDVNGNLWIYGGTNTNGERFSDLWKYDITTNQWTWVSGDNTTWVPATYGTKGQAAAGNRPGNRYGATGWMDAAGNFFMFGGSGVVLGDEDADYFALNDLWKYTPTTGLWTWIHGDNTSDEQPNYGTKGATAASNNPGNRTSASGFKDAAGNFWLFGGDATTSNGNATYSDMWRYAPTTNQWTWMAGEPTSNNNGVYGTTGQSAPGNGPGARTYALTWFTSSEQFWVLGGDGLAAAGQGSLNDLWMFNASNSMLPVRFSSFTARKEQNQVLLQWSTAQEQQSAYFLVERSADGVRYETIGKVKAAGNSNYTTTYSFTDQKPQVGNNFYRLRQVDLNEAYTYSTVVRVSFEASGDLSLLENPVAGNLRLAVQLPKAQTLTIQVKSNTGSTLLTRQLAAQKGATTLQIPVGQLAQGTYIVQVNIGQAGISKTFIKL